MPYLMRNMQSDRILPSTKMLGVQMKMNLWLIYIAFYVAFKAWAIWRLPEPVFVSVTDIIQMSMLAGIVGLALNKKLIGQALWKVASIIGGLMLIHSWLVMPFIYITNEISWNQIAIIHLFALPVIPIFIGLYIYAWRSEEIWN